MRRVRRVSVEVIRRELNLSFTRSLATSTTVRPDPPAADEHARSSNSLQATACPSCASPLFVIPAGVGEGVAITQRVLEANGIYSRLSTTGELLVCAKSLDLLAGASGVANLLSPTRIERGSTDLTNDPEPQDD